MMLNLLQRLLTVKQRETGAQEQLVLVDHELVEQEGWLRMVELDVLD